MVKLGVTLPVEDGLSARDYLQLAHAAEDHGYDSVWVGEVAGPEVFSMLGLMAASTSRIRVGSGIAGIHPRSAALTAMGFATLASAAPGRVLAGLGVSSPMIVQDWHGREFARPLATVEGYVRALRAAWAGERVEVEFPRVHGFRSGLLPPVAPPIVLGAMNPGMLRLAGRIADGVFITWCTPGEVAAKLALVREGERAAGRAPGTVWAMSSFWGYAGDRPDDAAEKLRRVVLQYAMVPTHRASFAATLPELDRATALWRDGDRRSALALVTPEAVARLCVVGDGAAIADRARALGEVGVELAVVLTPGAAAGDVDGPLATIAALAGATQVGAGR